eukprot:12687194-Heterocapsa_arctica.AAC.1
MDSVGSPLAPVAVDRLTAVPGLVAPAEWCLSAVRRVPIVGTADLLELNFLESRFLLRPRSRDLLFVGGSLGCVRWIRARGGV